MYTKTIEVLTKAYNQMEVITPLAEEAVKESGIQDGMVTVMTKHTTTGITVNEALECLESDIENALTVDKSAAVTLFAPEDRPYAHARMLRDYGSTAGNPTGHLKAMIVGNHCHFPVINGEMVRGGAQDIYFCEFDGPAKRRIIIIISKM